MKKLLFVFTLSLLFVGLAWGQGLEDFTNSNATASYNTSSFVGNNSITWSYVESRDGNGDANGSGIDLPALMLRQSSDNSAVSSSTISGGIGNFSVKLYKGFTAGGNRQVKLFINGVSKGTSTPFDDFDEHLFEVNGINVAGDVVIKILNITSKQVIVDDITWTGYATSTPIISVSPTSLTGLDYVLGNGPSAEQSFTVSGENLTANISITPPTNYEISTGTGASFVGTNPITLTPSSGTVGETPIYVRLKAGLAIGTYNEDITVTSTNADPQTVTCDGEVTAPPAPDAPVAIDATGTDSESFTANWNAVDGANGYYLDVYEKEAGGSASDLFFSEYIEGGSYNKAIEIFNGTGVAVNLMDYSVKISFNANPFSTELTLPDYMLSDGDVYVIAHGSANAAILAVADETHNTIANFNGNDALGLYNDGVLIDIFGVESQDPGSGWDVAGESSATANHTLVRKASIGQGNTDWAAQAGTDVDDSEWIVYAQDTTDYLGSHTFSGGTTLNYVAGFEDLDVSNVLSYEVTGLDPATTYYYVVRAYNTYGTSEDSNEIEVETLTGSLPPTAPVAAAATNVSHESFTANWDESQTATSYSLDVSTSNTFSTYVTGYNALTVNGTSQEVINLAAETTYYYRVRAVNANGSSVASNIISVSTSEDDPFDGYYATVDGLSGNALKTGLHDLIDTNTSSNYIASRTLLFQTLDKVDGNVRCVYTGQDYPIDNTYNGSSNPNTEHAYAQSWFDGTIESTKQADVHNLFITSSSVNSSRGNLPFDVVTNTTTSYDSFNGFVSKRGTNANGQTVFEPADQIKGNIARALLYFHVRYGQTLSQGGVDMLDQLISWHTSDPVDEDELEDNTLIFDFQSNRNPFIDHPEYVSSIWGGSVSNTTIQFSPASATVNEGDGTITLNIQIQNHSATATTADVVLSSGAAADVNNYSTAQITFPASSSADQTVTVYITDDSILEGTEQVVFAIQNVSGGNDATVGAYDSYALTIIDNDIPSPVATSATSITDDSFIANWNAASGITEYEFDLSTSSSFASFVDGYEAYPVSGTSLSVSELASNTIYYYRVRSLYNNGTSDNSNSIQLSTTGLENYVLLDADLPVFEDFNSLTSGDWNNGTTVTGWYAKTDATASIAGYEASTGTSTQGALYAFGIDGTNPLSDRALGMVASNSFTGSSGSGKGYIGWRIRNNTGSTIESITVTWTGEQWRQQNNAAAHTLELDYQIGALVTDLTAGSWTTANSVFTSPITGASGATELDGNAAANRVVDIEAIISGVSIAPNQEIMLRWVDINDSYDDHALAIDDVSVSVGYDYNDETPTEIAETGVTITVTGGNGFNHPNSAANPPNSSFNANFRRGIRLVGNGPWTITVATTNPWVAYLHAGSWASLSNASLTSVQFEIEASKGETIEILAGDGGNPTLPVELSTFTVALHSLNSALLTWVTQSETNVSGFYLYRNTAPQLDSALLISDLIPATNTSQSQQYLYRDKELAGPGTYYYWLQVSDLDGSISYYGPVSLHYEGEPGQNPEVPEITALKTIYPNPFNPSTSIAYGLAQSAEVSFSIYNSRGQLVRQIPMGNMNSGKHSFVWNGTDDSGRALPTGVYFIRMQAGSESFSKKAVLMK